MSPKTETPDSKPSKRKALIRRFRRRASRAAKELNILVIRPDRIGDVILSTPAIITVKKNFPKARLVVLVREAVAPLLRGLPEIDEVMIWEPEKRHAGFRGFFRLWKEIRKRDFRIALVLQTRLQIAFALLFAGIRYRVGPFSRFHSYLTFNRGIRQNRSQVEMHEADYNLQLLRKIGVREAGRSVPTRVFLSEEARDQAKVWLEARGWDESEQLIVVHPGMGGSALNWPESHFLELIVALVEDGRTVLVSGGAPDAELLRRMEGSLSRKSPPEDTNEKAKGDTSAPGKVIFMRGGEFSSIGDLAGLFSWAKVVIAPSTGPLHLAVALGIRTVSFYPPIRVQSALRWGPYLPKALESHASILVPEVFCGQDFKCKGPVCHYFPCMRGMTTAQALTEVRMQLKESKEK